MILVTGSDGSLGVALLVELRRRGEECVGVDISKCDVREERDVAYLLTEQNPILVYHLAADKHAGSGEEAPWDTVETNVVGTHNVLAHLPDGCRMILASSCKAANPETVYGATKLICERMVLNAGHSVARFYNVPDSSGNVFRIWEKIPADQPLPVADATRLFIDLADAVSLLLRVAELEPGRYVWSRTHPRAMSQVAEDWYPGREQREILLRRGDRRVEPAWGTSEALIVGDLFPVGQIINRHD
jgi:FlaA1/EpsC-like NDP-sugar epimerase